MTTTEAAAATATTTAGNGNGSNSNHGSNGQLHYRTKHSSSSSCSSSSFLSRPTVSNSNSNNNNNNNNHNSVQILNRPTHRIKQQQQHHYHQFSMMMLPLYNSKQQQQYDYKKLSLGKKQIKGGRHFSSPNNGFLFSILLVCVGMLLLFSGYFGYNIFWTKGKAKRMIQQEQQHLQQEQQQQQRMLLSNIPYVTTTTTMTSKKDPLVRYDVAIVGAGPAGLSAALFAARANLKVIVLGSPVGSLLAETTRLDNFPGYSFGYDSKNSAARQWLETAQVQALQAGAHFARPGLCITTLEQDDDGDDEDGPPKGFVLKTQSSESNFFYARSVILAMGATPRKLWHVAKTNLLWGKFLHNCVICDGDIYRHKRVLVVGGGDAALEAALYLRQSMQASQIYLVHRRTTFDKAKNMHLFNLLQQQLSSSQIIQVYTPYVVNKWLTADNDDDDSLGGELRLTGVILKRNDNSDTLDPPPKQDDAKDDTMIQLHIDGAFIMIGATPNTEWLKQQQNPQKSNTNTTTITGLPFQVDDTSGLIPLLSSAFPAAASSQATFVPGVFAAGQVTDGKYKQAITAAAEGARAALDAQQWLMLNHFPPKQHLHVGSPDELDDDDDDEDDNDSGADENKNYQHASSLLSKNKKEEEEEEEEQRHLDHEMEPQTNILNCNLWKEECITSIVQKYPVVVFSKPWCPYCHKALETLQLAISDGGGAAAAAAHAIKMVDLTAQEPHTRSIQSILRQMTGRFTVPNVFVNGQSIGGGDETVALHAQGKLVPLLQKAGVIPFRAKESEQHQQQLSDFSLAADCDLATPGCMQGLIQKHKLVVFSSHTCPECHMLLEFLQDVVGILPPQQQQSPEKFVVVEFGAHGNIAPAIRQQLYEQSGSRSVPSLFLNGQSLQGYRNVQALYQSGALVMQLRQAGIAMATASVSRP